MIHWSVLCALQRGVGGRLFECKISRHDVLSRGAYPGNMYCIATAATKAFTRRPHVTGADLITALRRRRSEGKMGFLCARPIVHVISRF